MTSQRRRGTPLQVGRVVAAAKPRDRQRLQLGLDLRRDHRDDGAAVEQSLRLLQRHRPRRRRRGTAAARGRGTPCSTACRPPRRPRFRAARPGGRGARSSSSSPAASERENAPGPTARSATERSSRPASAASASVTSRALSARLRPSRQPPVDAQRGLLAARPVEGPHPAALQAELEKLLERLHLARRPRPRRSRRRGRRRGAVLRREHRLRLGQRDLSRLARQSGASLVLSDQRVQLVLEPAGLDRAVDAALLRRVRSPTTSGRRGPARPASIARVQGAQPIDV